ncbi:MAG: YeeE/YedE thiosulfate transporter family protein [Gammaproteobacteria bacterium]|nr:YeeE/YedE thiosulfate transporter family protein [Gammaproteobacteria bacterium]
MLNSDTLIDDGASPTESLGKRLLRRQWPFWLGGLVVGLAEIVFYFHTDMFIVVTTGLAQMFAVSEEMVGIDWVARVYEPGIHWTIIAALLGARLVAVVEGESRGWVKYNWRILSLAFIGGLLFSFGTRLAAGCTTHHFMGGLPAMSIASWVVLLTGIPFAFIAFKIALWAGVGGYFKHQETRETARRHKDDPANPQPGYDANYNHWLNPMRWVFNAFLLITIFALPLYYGLTGWISGSVNQIGWSEVIWMAIPGVLLGFGIAKTGFGTECSVMAPEATFTKEEFYRKGGVPRCTYHMFRGMLPLQGFMVAIVVFNLFILAWWMLGKGSIPNASGYAGLYWGHILGGPLLAMGAVFMIGCEVRTYARLGLGYSTALVALPGFYIGYLPYTLFQEQIDPVVFGAGLTDFITIPEWAAYAIGGSQEAWAIAYSLVLIGLLAMSFQASRSFLGLKLKQILYYNTDEIVYGSARAAQPATTGKPALEPAG